MRIFVVAILLILLSALSFRKGYYYAKPTAIEVYQGKTTLKYTVVNGEIVDSVVVYK